MSEPFEDPAEIEALFARWGGHGYDEVVSQVDHARQVAAILEQDGAPETLVLAGLLHDVGHLLDMEDRGDPTVPAVDTRHEERGAAALGLLYGPEVCEPIRLHVLAKRVLLVTDPSYAAGLSEGSRASAVRQGGPASDAEIDELRANPYGEAALMLRRADDAGKVVGLVVPPWEHFGPLLAAVR
jgi:predicted HD phosphohydrolase